MEIQHFKLYIWAFQWVNFFSASFTVWMQIWNDCLKLSCPDWDLENKAQRNSLTVFMASRPPFFWSVPTYPFRSQYKHCFRGKPSSDFSDLVSSPCIISLLWRSLPPPPAPPVCSANPSVHRSYPCDYFTILSPLWDSQCQESRTEPAFSPGPQHSTWDIIGTH